MPGMLEEQTKLISDAEITEDIYINMVLATLNINTSTVPNNL